jgi:hypothetical protein
LNKDKKQESTTVSKAESDKFTKIESEKWQAKAVETSCTFLPSECPLVGHVISSYQKHHSIISESIPEDKELDDDLTFVRPLNEIKQDCINYHQIIKNHVKSVHRAPMPPKPSVKQANSIKNSRYFNEIQELTRSLVEKIPKENNPIQVENPKRLKVYEHAANRYVESDKR